MKKIRYGLLFLLFGAFVSAGNFSDNQKAMQGKGIRTSFEKIKVYSQNRISYRGNRHENTGKSIARRYADVQAQVQKTPVQKGGMYSIKPVYKEELNLLTAEQKSNAKALQYSQSQRILAQKRQNLRMKTRFSAQEESVRTIINRKLQEKRTIRLTVDMPVSKEEETMKNGFKMITIHGVGRRRSYTNSRMNQKILERNRPRRVKELRR